MSKLLDRAEDYKYQQGVINSEKQLLNWLDTSRSNCNRNGKYYQIEICIVEKEVGYSHSKVVGKYTSKKFPMLDKIKEHMIFLTKLRLKRAKEKLQNLEL